MDLVLATDRSARGPLRPLELATAAVLGGVTAAVSVVAVLIPAAGGVQLLAAVPMGVIAQRHRPRALLAATVAATVVAFIVAGTAPTTGVWLSALLGGMVGDVKRRGRGRPTILLYAVVVSPLLALIADATLLVFARSRNLVLDTIRNTMHGVTQLLGRVDGLAPAAADADRLTGVAVQYWWVSVAVVVIATVLVGTWFSWVVIGAVLERLTWVGAVDHLDATLERGEPGPLPAVLTGVSFRYPGSSHDGLSGVNLTVEPGVFLAVMGRNGSGKSTLARVLAGAPPSAGTVTRPGAVGLGQLGGTAVVSQRPESQVLGVLVADDVVWGLPVGTDVDVEGLLDAVGLTGLRNRYTSTLSGGELQRLAVAAALARRPRLLISDESTSMVDAAGRQALIGILAALPRRYGMAVVHVTHLESEATRADRVVHLRDGRIAPAERLDPGADRTAGLPTSATTRPPWSPTPILQLLDVGHTYAAGTPWEQPALRGVRLAVDAGEGVLVVGGNGSGKSTLAWVLAGLLRPSEGRCLLDGRPVDEQVGGVALAFQHARLQVQRPTVGEDIVAAAGRSDWVMVADALRSVGLDPALASRGVDALSGGQLRRVALAGLLARRPRVLVLDEPLAGLDAPSRRGLVDVLADLRRTAGLTLVVISHDVEGMGAACSRTVGLECGRLAAPVPAAGTLLAGGRR